MNNTQSTDRDAVDLSKAIIDHESGGNFTAKGKSKEYGAAQWIEPTWNEEAQKYLGYVPKWGTSDMTPEVQKAVLYSKVLDGKKQGLNPAQIAAQHNSGSPEGWENKVGVNQYGVKYDVPAYVKAVTDLYQKNKQKDGFIRSPNLPTSDSKPEENTSVDHSGTLGTNPNDSTYGKVIDNSLTRRLINAVPGAKDLGEGLGSSLAYLGEKAKGLFGGQDNSEYVPKADLGKTAMGALKVAGTAAAVAGPGLLANSALKGVSALSNPSLDKALAEQFAPKAISEFKTMSNAAKLNRLTDALPDASASSKLVMQKAINELTPLAEKELGLSPSLLKRAVSKTGRVAGKVTKGLLKTGLEAAGLGSTLHYYDKYAK